MIRSLYPAVLVLVLTASGAHAAPPAAYNLGVRAYIAKDYSAARKHWAKAVDEDVTSAFNNLGFLYYTGLGGAAEPKRAVSLWRTAAMRGHFESQHHLAEAYAEGKGVARDLVESYAWYRTSLANTPPPSRDDGDDRELFDKTRDDLLRLLGAMPVDQLPTAERRARDYIARFPAKPASR